MSESTWMQTNCQWRLPVRSYSLPCPTEGANACSFAIALKSKAVSSAFGISVHLFRRETFKVVQGQPGALVTAAASGHALECASAVICGSRVWHQSSGSRNA